jgi:hypothetical protein
MCVVIVAKNNRPDQETLEAGAWSNPQGAGVAWFETNAVGELGVKWEKGITDVSDVIKLAEELPLPYVVHFRIATAGGDDALLTHPFPVSKNAGLAFTGSAKRVLFHNGHWPQWEATMAKLALQQCVAVPKGVWSDTRAMAWITAHIGELALKALGEKVALMDADTKEIRLYGGWEYYKGLQVSNSYSFHSYEYGLGGSCGYAQRDEWGGEDEWSEVMEYHTAKINGKVRDSQGRWVGGTKKETGNKIADQVVVEPQLSCPECGEKLERGVTGGYWCNLKECKVTWLSEREWFEQIVTRCNTKKTSQPVPVEKLDARGCFYTENEDGGRVYSGDMIELGGEA